MELMELGSGSAGPEAFNRDDWALLCNASSVLLIEGQYLPVEAGMCTVQHQDDFARSGD